MFVIKHNAMPLRDRPDQPRRQGRYWLATISQHCFTPYLAPGVAYIKGQLERGEETGFLHWQLIICYAKKVSLSVLRRDWGPQHFELSRSSAAEQYVWKEVFFG